MLVTSFFLPNAYSNRGLEGSKEIRSRTLTHTNTLTHTHTNTRDINYNGDR